MRLMMSFFLSYFATAFRANRDFGYRLFGHAGRSVSVRS